MNENFEKALAFCLRWEGFISDDAHDKGSLTIYGISKRSHPKAVEEMYQLILNGNKKDEAFQIAKKIYYENYWVKSGCENMEFPLDIINFDTAVNMGRSKAQELLEKSKGDWKDYLLERLYTYSKFEQAKLYFRGWANRVLSLYELVKEEENEG